MTHQAGEIASAVLETIVGPLVISADRQAVISIEFGRDGAAGYPDAGAARVGSPVLQAAVTQLGEYFAGTRRRFELPLRCAGTSFQQQVWLQIAAIPYGAVLTYGEIGVRLGNCHLARAVGQAANRNPLPIIVPCHRVVGTAGWLGGFAPGVRFKEILLRHEQFR